MTFIHTADWHLGNKMHEIDRSGEFAAFLEWLKSEIIEEKAGTLVVSGDIFDVANPPIESRKLYCRFLASLLGTCCKNVIIVGGNHDSGALLDSEKDILEALNVHVVGSLANLQPKDMVFELFDDAGQGCGICAAIPFAREIELRSYFDEDVGAGKFSDMAYGALYQKVYEAADKLRNGRKIPIIATGHLYAADLEGRENSSESQKFDDGVKVLDVAGNLGSVHASVFPEAFDYVALGHIHYTTKVGKNPKIQYSGSPFVLGFDEANMPRNVLKVSCEFGEACKVEKRPVPQFAVYKRLQGNSQDIKGLLEKLIKENPPLDKENSKPSSAGGSQKDEKVKNIYLELYYQKEMGVDIREALDQTISNLPKNIEIANWRAQDVKTMLNKGYQDVDIDQLKNFSEDEIFTALISAKIKYPENCSEDEAEKIRQTYIEKFLPYFKEIAAEVNYEN